MADEALASGACNVPFERWADRGKFDYQVAEAASIPAISNEIDQSYGKNCKYNAIAEQECRVDIPMENEARDRAGADGYRTTEICLHESTVGKPRWKGDWLPGSGLNLRLTLCVRRR
jgi:hypothetical protein